MVTVLSVPSECKLQLYCLGHRLRLRRFVKAAFSTEKMGSKTGFEPFRYRIYLTYGLSQRLDRAKSYLINIIVPRGNGGGGTYSRTGQT